MKCKCVFVKAISLSLFAFNSFAQSETYSFIPSKYLAITYNKTTNLIFPFPVQSIDRGSKDILVQQAKGTENIVQVKADKPNFSQTNLTIITVDGRLYSFIVDYDSQPSQLNIIVAKNNTLSSDSGFKEVVQLSSGKNEAAMQSVARKISKTKSVYVKRDRHSHMLLQLDGIYVNRDVLYFQLQLKNNSNVSYDVDGIKFCIKDKQKSKRTATQELEIQPIYNYRNIDKVQGDSSASCIIALPKFTLPDSKYLSIQILEKGGSRSLNLTLKNRHIMKALAISELD
jgi:conjugative transposon TraN protein